MSGQPGTIELNPVHPVNGQPFTATWYGANEKSAAATIGIFPPVGDPYTLMGAIQLQSMNTGPALYKVFQFTAPTAPGLYSVNIHDQDGPGASTTRDNNGNINPTYADKGGYFEIGGPPTVADGIKTAVGNATGSDTPVGTITTVLKQPVTIPGTTTQVQTWQLAAGAALAFLLLQKGGR